MTKDINLDQDLSRVNSDPLFVVFLNLMKSYDRVDREHLIRNFEGYSTRQQMCKLFATLWDHQEVVTRHNGHRVPNFKATQEMTQGELISTNLFNVVV